jgi:hypothetical protein
MKEQIIETQYPASVDEAFIERQSGLVVPVGADPDGDPVIITEEDVSEPIEKRPDMTKFVQKYPDWEPNLDTQIATYTRMLELNWAEIEVVQERIKNIEILIDQFPLWAAPQDVLDLRKLSQTSIRLGQERLAYANTIQQISLKIQQKLALEEAEKAKKVKKVSWFARKYNAFKSA